MEGKQDVLPEKRYERSMNHNYMILSSYTFFEHKEEENYMTKMLLGNKIPGLLPVVCRKNAGETQYCYEINSLQSLDRLYEKQEMGYEAFFKLLSGCIRIFERLEEYLMDGSQILLHPEYVFLHMDTLEPYLVCYPNYDGDVRYSFQKLMDYLLTKIDHTHEQTVWFAYQVYRYTRNPNYVLGEIKELLYETEERKENSSFDRCDEEMEAREENAFVKKSERLKREHKDCMQGEDEETDENNRYKEEGMNTWNKNVLGALFCGLLVLSAVGIIFGARLLKLIPLSHKQEVSLYGAIGMSVVAAGIFCVSIIKRWQQEKQMEELRKEPEEEETILQYWKLEEKASQEIGKMKQSEKKAVRSNSMVEQDNLQHTSELVGATTLLSEEIMQERVLKGTVNGEEIRIPLCHFPLTLGKLAQLCDYVIPDHTVSRMHARLVQKNGKVYISDLNSTNGTIRNGNMIGIHEEVAMEPGDEIVLGRVCFTYC